MKTARQTSREAHELWRACFENGALDQARARLVVDRVIESKRGGAHAVLAKFLRLLRLYDAERSALVTSAASLDPPLRADIERNLARLHGSPLATRFEVDPALIGGMRVQIGSRVYDGSLRSGLAALASRF